MITVELLREHGASDELIDVFTRHVVWRCPGGVTTSEMCLKIMLNQGMGQWWRWMATKGIVPESLSDRELHCANLEEANLSRMDLSRIDLHGSRLVAANLRDAVLHSARLSMVEAACSDLRRANMRFASLIHSCFLGATMTGADLMGAIILGCDFEGADLRGSNLSECHIGYGHEHWGHAGEAKARKALESANISGARYTTGTRWPVGFDPVAAGAALVDAPSDLTPDEAQKLLGVQETKKRYALMLAESVRIWG